jgi:hypothetical protein
MRMNMHCLVTSGKHVNGIRVIARQPPITIEGHQEAVFLVGYALSYIARAPGRLSAVQFSSVQFSSVQFSSVQFSSVQFSEVK